MILLNVFKYRSSIRQKIILGYYTIVAVIVGLSLFAFVELRFIEKKVIFGDVISEFFDTTLEIRRFEKNFFLYGQQSDYLENIGYIEKAEGLLGNNTRGFESIADPQQIAKLKEDLRKYKGLIDLYASGKSKEISQENSLDEPLQRIILEKQLRTVGKDIITVAEGISKTERKYIQSLLGNSQNIIIFSIISLILMAIIIGRILSHMVVKPLQMLEESMGVIAEGKFERVSINSHDREILSLANAFNTMLKELEQRQRHLVQSEKLASLGTLLSGVAHELNNPLSNISSSCQILAEEIEDTDISYKKELLSQIDEQTDRARNIVRSLLEFSREKVFKKELLQLRSLFDETIRFVKGQVPTNIAIVLDIPDEIFIYADKQRIQQAFLNLIRNAIDAMGDTGDIHVKASRHNAIDKVEEEAEIYNYLKYHGKCTLEEDTVDIMIRDNGPGIPEEILLKIFDPFFTTKDVGRGSGLGLFIVHEIIDEHDGCIAVDSTVQKGTTFLIRLPLRKT
ncbi:MAG: signal transduction histidine kinase [Nitrospirae bacterium]|nr:signal transduction histidine kinase [Nitrospirota bacterium]